jgi:hypothetical protein
VLERACKAAAERADNDFRALLLSQQQEGAISARSTWSAVKAQVSRRPAAGCPSLAAALARCFGALGGMLPLLLDQLLTCCWGLCRVVCFVSVLQLWSDIRYQSLPEDRRLQLFNEFMLEFRQQQAVADAAAAAEAAAAASAAAAATTSAPSAPGSSNGTSSPATGSFSTLATEDLDLGVDAAGMAPEDLAKLQLLRWEQQRLRQEYQKMSSCARWSSRSGPTHRHLSPGQRQTTSQQARRLLRQRRQQQQQLAVTVRLAQQQQWRGRRAL